MVGIQFVMTMAFSMLTPIMPLFLPELGVTNAAAIDIWAGILSGVTSFIAAFASPVWGRVADRHGRKRSLVISVLLMCGGSLMVALLPTYAAVGALAPGLLLLARLLQGLSVGGEYGATATYMSEVALRGRRGFYSSFQYVTLIGGQLLAVLLIVLLQQVLSEADLRAWGWRIPFAVSAVAAVVAFWLRSTLHETLAPDAAAKAGAGAIGEVFRHHTPAFLVVLGFTAAGSLIFYTFTTYMQKYLVNSAGMSTRTASNVMTGCLALYMCVQPLFGMLSDRIGRRSNMLLFGALGTVATVPIFNALSNTRDPATAFLLITLALAIVSFYTSVSGIVKAELFPPHVRALGVGLAYAIANAVFGGSAEYVALDLKAAGHEQAFYWYVTVMMAIAFLVSLRLPRQPSYLHEDP
ncbi:MAG: MFS transporter [Rhizobacter sp.]|nr:MFS transporter [Rhizobacter sp.]